jgi:hypothetical protein
VQVPVAAMVMMTSSFFGSDQERIDLDATEFREDVELIFARNGIAVSFGDDMRPRLGLPEAPAHLRLQPEDRAIGTRR